MTIADSYLNNDYRVVSYRISIGGVALTRFVSCQHSFNFERVPTASIRLRAADVPATAVFNKPVIIEEGFDGLYQTVFTGTVLNVNPDETGRTIECQGMSAPLDNAYHKVVVTFNGTKTTEEWAEYLLDQAGIEDYVVDIPEYTPGTTPLGYDDDGNPVYTTLEFNTYGEAITKIAESVGGRWYETPTGVVRVEVKNSVPSLSVWRTYFSMRLAGLVETYPTGIASGRPRLRRLAGTQQTRDVKNQVWVRGAVMTTTNLDGSKNSVTVEGNASAPSPWVLNPDGSQAYNDLLFSNEIIDDAVWAGLLAGDLVAVYNRQLMEVPVEIDGDPQVQLGVTVGIEDPDYSGLTGRWFVEGYSTTLEANSYKTTLNVLGGPEAGSTINISPFANFVYSVDYEVMGDREWAIVTFDASASIDPDGTIVDYDFIDNQTPHVIDVNGAEPVRTVRFDPAAYTPPLEVTLTVTDDDGATDALTITVIIEPGGAAVTVPALFAAFDDWASASPDGGVNWNDQGMSGSGVMSVGAKPPDGVTSGVAVYGTIGGALYRTTDFCATAPTLVMAAVGSPITHVWWDMNHPTDCWACSQNGGLYRSQDNGATWALYENLAATFGLANIRLQRIATPAPDGVWVFGGTGTGYPLIAWDATRSHNWTGATLGGELSADLGAGVAGIYVAEAASREVGELAIILNSATFMPAVYYTADIFGDGSAWKRCLACPAKSRGRWIAPDWVPGQFVFGFDDNVCYTGDVAAGVMTAAVAAAALDAGDAPNHGLWLGGFVIGIGSCYIVAAEGTADGTLYKSWDRFGTIAKLRPATGFPANANGTSTAISNTTLTDASKSWVVNRYVGQKVTSNGKTLIVTSNTATVLTGTGGWSGGGNPGSGHAYTIFPNGANAKMVAIGAAQLAAETEARVLIAGRLTAPKCFVAWRIGLGNWTSYTFANELGSGTTGMRVRALTPDLWFIINFADDFGDADDKVVRTKNGGTAWASFTTPKSGNDYWLDFAIDAGGRVWGITFDQSSPYTTKVWYSDDEGDTWTLAYTYSATGSSWTWPHCIACHPTNQNIIVVTGSSGALRDRVRTFSTLNRGSSWTANYDGSSDYLRGTWPTDGLAVLDNGRLVLIGNARGADIHVATSDDWGITWTNRETWALVGTPRLIGPGSSWGTHLFTLAASTPNQEVYWSPDYGTTWALFDNQPTIPTNGASAGIGYDLTSDSLFVFVRENVTTNAALVFKMTPVLQAGTWIDFSDSLLPIGAETKYLTDLGQQLAVIPR